MIPFDTTRVRGLGVNQAAQGEGFIIAHLKDGRVLVEWDMHGCEPIDPKDLAPAFSPLEKLEHARVSLANAQKAYELALKEWVRS